MLAEALTVFEDNLPFRCCKKSHEPELKTAKMELKEKAATLPYSAKLPFTIGIAVAHNTFSSLQLKVTSIL